MVESVEFSAFMFLCDFSWDNGASGNDQRKGQAQG